MKVLCKVEAANELVAQEMCWLAHALEIDTFKRSVRDCDGEASDFRVDTFPKAPTKNSRRARNSTDENINLSDDSFWRVPSVMKEGTAL